MNGSGVLVSGFSQLQVEGSMLDAATGIIFFCRQTLVRGYEALAMMGGGVWRP